MCTRVHSGRKDVIVLKSSPPTHVPPEAQKHSPPMAYTSPKQAL